MFNEIEESLKNAIAYSQEEANPQIEQLMSDWMENKEKFLHRFGGPIYECPEVMTFSLDQKAKDARLNGLIEYISCNCLNPDLGIFIEKNKDSFFDNKVCDTMDTSGVVPGMKLVKSFKFFEDNKELLTEFQNRASQVIQEDKITGKLCFSVHPLDFLTSSENTHGWRSCHSLDGQYRAGNLSYIADSVTFMVYIKSEQDVYLPAIDQEWNNKKWRMLVYAADDDSIMFAGRQYPFDASGVLEKMREVYSELIRADYTEKNSLCDKVRYSEWTNDYVTKVGNQELSHRYLPYNSDLVALQNIVFNSSYNMAYNDVLNSSLYTKPYYSVLQDYRFFGNVCVRPSAQSIKVGARVNCIHCGHALINRKGGHSMRCDECELDYGGSDNEDICVCNICGRRVFIDDAYELDGAGYDLVCDSCFDKECFECENCGRLFYNCDLNIIRYEDGSAEKYCYYCAKDKE